MSTSTVQQPVLCKSCKVGLSRVGENEQLSLCRPCSWRWAEAFRAKEEADEDTDGTSERDERH